MRTRLVLSVCSLVVTCLLTSTASAVTQYTITDLGTLGGEWSTARAINNWGVVVGASELPDGSPHAFLWQEGAMTDLGTLGGVESSAAAINDSGQICGGAYRANGHVEAYVWQDGVMTGLGSFGQSSDADDINNLGQITGWTDVLYGSRTAYLWQGGSMATIGLVSSGAVNDAGQVVGQIEVGLRKYAGLWENGTGTSLGSLGGYWSMAHDLTESGVVVGHSEIPGGETRAFLWENGVMGELPTLAADSCAYGVNEMRQIVGDSYASGHYAAVLWQDGTICRLADLLVNGSGWRVDRALDINDRGQIVGYGIAPNGQKHAFLLTPIPEPSVLALLLLGAFGAVFRWRRGP